MDESCLDGLEDRETRAEAGRTRSVPVLERAFTALELLAISSNGLTLPDVARKLQIPKSSAHCILLHSAASRLPESQRPHDALCAWAEAVFACKPRSGRAEMSARRRCPTFAN